jgi:hypothetical protein
MIEWQGQKMDPEVKAKWVEALRSGEYKQGQLLLKKERPDGTAKHCCLGVLCEITGVMIEKGQAFPFFDMEPEKSWQLHPADAETLATVNDGIGQFAVDGPATFEQIAQLIEDNL